MAGLLLGWLLVRTHPRAGLTATTFLCLAGLVWALLVPGKWYLVSFGILGAGELYGVYYPNYLISCSPTSMVRRNLAYANLLALPVTPGSAHVRTDFRQLRAEAQHRGGRGAVGRHAPLGAACVAASAPQRSMN